MVLQRLKCGERKDGSGNDVADTENKAGVANGGENRASAPQCLTTMNCRNESVNFYLLSFPVYYTFMLKL